jgi:hypothetical protein
MSSAPKHQDYQASMRGIGYEEVPEITFFSGACPAEAQGVHFLPLYRPKRVRALSLLVAALRRSTRFLVGSKE